MTTDPYLDAPPPDAPADEIPDAFRAQPSDVDAERFLLSAMLSPRWGRDAVDAAVLRGLKPKHFWRIAHERIYEAITHLYETGVVTDPAAVVARLRQTGEITTSQRLDVVVSDLFALDGSALAAPHHVEAIKETWTRRAGIAVGLKIQQLCASAGDLDANTLMSAVQAEVDALVDDAAFGRRGTTVAEALDDVLDAMESATLVTPTPWPDLNRIIGGTLPGSLYVVAGETGGGKTITGVQWAYHLAHRLGLPVAYCTPEMTRRQVVSRLFAQIGRVNLSSIIKGGEHLSKDDWRSIARAASTLRTGGPDGGPVPIYVDDAGSLTVGDVLAAYRACKREYGECRAIFVDYLQLVTPPKGRGENRQVEVAGIAYALAALAKALDVPIIALAQFNRAPSSNGRRPRKTDLRESGVIEQVAAMILLLYRLEEDPSLIEFIIDKNRQGETTVNPPEAGEDGILPERPPGAHPLHRFDGAFSRILSLAPEQDQHDPLPIGDAA